MKITPYRTIVLLALMSLIYSLNLRSDSTLQSSNEANNYVFNKASNTSDADLNTTQTAGASNNSTVPAAPKPPMVKNTTNVAGNLKVPNIQISSSPYNVTSCDQVLLIPAKRIFPENDYTKKVDAFFTMSAYMVNLFESKDSNKLLDSIAMSHMKTMPYVLQGSKNCLHFQDSVTFRKISMCIEDANVLQEIQTAFMTLFNCRNGGKMPQPDQNVEKLMKVLCEMPKDHKNYEEVRKSLSEELQKVGLIVTDKIDEFDPKTYMEKTGRKIFDTRVPGTYEKQY